jgi:hypothetical protein
LNKNGIPAGWYFPRNPDQKKLVSIDRGVFRTGGCSLKIDGGTGGAKLCVAQVLPDMKPNAKYLLTFFAKTENVVPTDQGQHGGGAVVTFLANRNQWYPKNWYRGTMPWRKQGFIIETDANVNARKPIYLRLRLMQATGTVWFDDVQVREMNENDS